MVARRLIESVILFVEKQFPFLWDAEGTVKHDRHVHPSVNHSLFQWNSAQIGIVKWGQDSFPVR